MHLRTIIHASFLFMLSEKYLNPEIRLLPEKSHPRNNFADCSKLFYLKRTKMVKLKKTDAIVLGLFILLFTMPEIGASTPSQNAPFPIYGSYVP